MADANSAESRGPIPAFHSLAGSSRGDSVCERTAVFAQKQRARVPTRSWREVQTEGWRWCIATLYAGALISEC